MSTNLGHMIAINEGLPLDWVLLLLLFCFFSSVLWGGAVFFKALGREWRGREKKG